MCPVANRPLPCRPPTCLEPMTGLEPVTSSLPRTRSTTELHRRTPEPTSSGSPAETSQSCAPERRAALTGEGWSGRRGSNPRPTAWKAVTLPLSYSRLRAGATPCRRFGGRARSRAEPPFCQPQHPALPAGVWFTSRSPAAVRHIAREPWRGEAGGEGRIRTSEATRATDLQSVAFDRSATSPTFRDHSPCSLRRRPQTPGDGRSCRNSSSNCA